MKKTILATVVLVGVLGTGAYAYGNCDGSGQKGMMNQQNMQQKSKQCSRSTHKMNQKMVQHHGKMGRHGGMQMFSQLNLSKDQQFNLSVLRDEMKLEMKKLRGVSNKGKMLQFVGDNGFDKKAFMQSADIKHTKMMEIKANHMEKVFNLLTKEQITELKKNLNK